MKSELLKAAFCCLAGVMLASCGSDKTDGFTSRVSLEGYEYDYIVELPDSLALEGDGGKYVRFSGQGVLPEKIGGEEIQAVRDSLMRLGGIKELDRASAMPLLDEGYKMTTLDPKKDSACSTRYNELTVTMVSPRLVVWRDYAYSYLCRSAHGVYNTTYVNYSIPKKKILELADIFKPGYEAPLAELLREKLKDDNIDLSVPLKEVGVPDDFEITETGIRFVYPLYEIAPYVEGEIAVELESYQLDDILNDGISDFLWQKVE